MVHQDQETKRYYRICPKCNERVTGRSRSYILRSDKAKTICVKCMKSMTNQERKLTNALHPDVYEFGEGWAKNCPSCQGRQTYVRRIIANKSAKAGTLCLPCSNKNVGKNVFMGWHRGIRVSWFNKYKNSNLARKHDYEFSINIDDVADVWEAQGQQCALSGLPLEFKSEGRHDTGQPSLDRIDSNQGYIKGNIQILDSRVNVMKNQLGQAEFVTLCRMIGNNSDVVDIPITQTKWRNQRR